MTKWDHSVDLVSVGSGGGGLMTALAVADAGLSSIVIEKTERVGGSTAMSGGILWLPANPLMAADGDTDTIEDGLRHMAAVIGDVGPASTPAKREAYVRQGNAMVEWLQGQGVGFLRAKGYADYYSSLPGGHVEGRSIEPKPYDASRIPRWADLLPPGIAAMIGMPVLTNELRQIQYVNRSRKVLGVAARVGTRTVGMKLRRRRLLTNGSALVANLLEIADRLQVPIWTGTPLQDLVTEDGRVTGVVVERDGAPYRIEARRGVLVAAGGFGHNAGMRAKFGGEQTVDGSRSMANPGDTGEVLEMLMGLGAETDLLDEAWWLPSVVPELGASTIGQARQRPGAILVNKAGRRFVNEADSMVEVGQAIFAESGGSCWAVTDHAYQSRYVSSSGRGGVPEEWVTNGWLKRADTLEELADQIGLDASVLVATVTRFNEHAAEGNDPDFGRGESAYNTCMGDPGWKPNPALGPLIQAPFYAAAIEPADVGTCGGVVTDEHARVLASDGPIEGLYATGNITATVMGRSYPGAGASIANTMVFGYAAAQHVLAR